MYFALTSLRLPTRLCVSEEKAVAFIRTMVLTRFTRTRREGEDEKQVGNSTVMGYVWAIRNLWEYQLVGRYVLECKKVTDVLFSCILEERSFESSSVS